MKPTSRDDEGTDPDHPVRRGRAIVVGVTAVIVLQPVVAMFMSSGAPRAELALVAAIQALLAGLFLFLLWTGDTLFRWATVGYLLLVAFPKIAEAAFTQTWWGSNLLGLFGAFCLGSAAMLAFVPSARAFLADREKRWLGLPTRD